MTTTLFTMRDLRDCETPAEVLEECLLDIRDGLWVCNVLHEWNYAEHNRVAKPMGCAVGLIGINTNNCEIMLERGPKATSYHARFTQESVHQWSDLAQQTALVLANALNELHPERYSEVLDNPAQAEERIIGYNDGGNLDVENQEICEGCSTVCDGCETGGENLTAQQAADWFAKALEIASR